MSWGALTFLAPLTFLGLLALPVVWWILKISPPRPRSQTFPPLQILRDVETEEQTPAATPLWLLLFRLLLVALAVFALAQPFLKASETQTKRPLTLIIDQSVTAAPLWDKITSEAEAKIKEARRDNLTVRLVPTAEDTTDFIPANEALKIMKSLTPVPYMVSADDVALQLNRVSLDDTDIAVLSSGLTDQNDIINNTLQGTNTDIFIPDVQAVLMPGDVRETSNGFETDWYRPSTNGRSAAQIEAISGDNSILAVEPLTFAPGSTLATASIALPPQLRAKITKLRVQGVRSAASLKLLDDSFGRPLVGVLSPPADSSSPLLTEPFYAKQALAPYADIFEGDEETLLALQPSIIVMPDSMRSDSQAIKDYIETGGVLIRFAGSRLAKRKDELLPVVLRDGGRAIGGALAWEDPQRLAAFNEESPFFGLNVPEEVTVSKQVMAEPGIETDTRTWARLEDGSPIVTQAVRGDGRIILFHVTAGPEWSNLALSGLYVDMLRRILPLTKGRAPQVTNTEADWILDRALDAYGQLQSPPIQEQRLTTEQFKTQTATHKNLPGYYRQGTRQKALAVIQDPTSITPLTAPRGTTLKTYGENAPKSLTGKLLGLCAALLALDALFALWVSGHLRFLRPSRTFAGLILAAIITTPHIAEAQDDTRILEAASGLHLAYVITGDARQDDLSRTALESLSTQLTLRTTIEPAGVHGVSVDDAGLEMYPFLYWPVRRDSPALTPEATATLNGYMSSGGTIVFDTADEGDRALRAGAPHPGLTRITKDLDIPRLATIPEDHVLTKSFYLLQVFPGRCANGPVYVQAGSNSSGGRDGVSSVIIGSNDWAAGWATDEDVGSLIELNKDIPRQREMSVRFGINVAMYTLSGNYKADQVHAAALVERLGRANQPKPSIEP